MQILQAFFPVWYVLILCIIKVSEVSHSSQDVPGIEIRTQKKEVRLGELGRWGKRSPLSGEMASYGNRALPTGVPGICGCPDIRTRTLAPVSFLPLPWTMMLPHQTVPWPLNLKEQV